MPCGCHAMRGKARQGKRAGAAAAAAAAAAEEEEEEEEKRNMFVRLLAACLLGYLTYIIGAGQLHEHIPTLRYGGTVAVGCSVRWLAWWIAYTHSTQVRR
ncbi:hypothetical protein BKA80DRAFT_281419 [Phyllosticta citrichinensis]